MMNGWSLKSLGEISTIQRGLTYSGKDTVDISSNIVLRATNIILDTGKLNFDELKYLRDDFEVDDKFKVQKGSLLICFSSGSKEHLGKVALVDDTYENFSFGGFIGQITPLENINSRFIYYNLISDKYKVYIRGLTDGANINNLKMGDLKGFTVPIPPLPEQKRIVAILDEAFTAIDQAKANIERNIENANELFQSKLNQIFRQSGDEWEINTLSQLSKLITKGSSPKWQGVKYIENQEILFITSENVGTGEILLNKRKFLEYKFNEIETKSILKKGDVLTNIVGASIGRTAIYDMDDIANINQAVCLIRCEENLLYNRYLMHLLNSPYFLQIMSDNEVNMARANLSLTFFRNLKIAVPPLKIQFNIVERIDKLKATNNVLLNKYNSKLDRLTELKKSLLQKAFSGELTGKGVEV